MAKAAKPKVAAEKGKAGRPVGSSHIYTDELAEHICVELSKGFSLASICSRPEMPAQQTIYSWIQNRPDFREKYARAREEQADTHFDAMLDIADKAEDVNKARLQIEARKWVLGKLRPKKYGESADIRLAGHDGGAVKIESTVLSELQIAQRAAFALRKAAETIEAE